MNEHDIEGHIFHELNSTSTADYKQYKLFFRYLIDKLSRGNRLHLYSLFSKIAYLDGKVSFDENTRRALHCVRKFIEDGHTRLTDRFDAAFQYAIRVLLSLNRKDDGIELEILNWGNRWASHDDRAYEIIDSREVIRAAIVHADFEEYRVNIIDENHGNEYTARFNVHEVNEQFNISIRHLESRITLPVIAHFLDCRFVSESEFIPGAIIIDPDYLVDVTAIAECFMPNMELPLMYLMKQVLPKAVSPYLLIGNIANAILDRFMLGEPLQYSDVMTEAFRQFAIEFTLLSDDAVRLVSNQIRMMLNHLFEDVNTLKAENKNNLAYIEPTFISEKYGIQGRLDALFLDLDYKAGKIVELKSGKPYKTNEFGLNRNHYVQTTLYDMAVKSAFGDTFQSTNYILYAKLKEQRLRQAPSIKQVQFEAIKIRNDIVAISHHLMNSEPNESLLFKFDHPVFTQAGGFIRTDAAALFNITSKLDEIERQHLSHYVALVTAENYLAKVGGEIRNKRYGFAALWQSNAMKKEEKFNILRKIKILKKEDKGLYVFQLPENNSLTNFRTGDIVILYPHSREENPIAGQLLKGSIIKISKLHLVIRLRNLLIREEVFESIEYWNAEHDYIESSSRQAMRGLMRFYHANRDARKYFLGIQAGIVDRIKLPDEFRPDLHDHQRNLLSNILGASPYYLLWGPPGTGKTSIMLSALVDYVMHYTDESILLIAYTNRAVDEICSTLNVKYSESYTRIGSRFSVAQEFQEKLLQRKLSEYRSRKEVSGFLQSCRIFTGTVASVLGKEELFALKKFDRLIVDEASQILEPYLLGLVGHVQQTVFIGDHKQLPAVVSSSKEHTVIESDQLTELGFEDSATSLFERLLRQNVANNWSNAVGRLYAQGRMHQDICTFVSDRFYGGKLQIVQRNGEVTARLTQPIEKFYSKGIPVYEGKMLNRRIEIIHAQDQRGHQLDMLKYSEAEANVVVKLCDSIVPNLPEHATVGIVCPFRAHIALVTKKLEAHFGNNMPTLTVDTVERYQGGARDVIIISTCSVNKRTFDAIHAYDVDGVDRKLNVALSRSREQIFLIGNVDVMKSDQTYAELITYANHL